MNLKSRLRHIASLSAQFRAIGRTTYNANLAKENGGMVIAANFDQAKYIERTHNVPSRSMEMNLEGYTGPFFVDHNAMDILLVKAANKIEELEKQNKEIQKQNEQMKSAISEAINEVNAGKMGILSRYTENKLKEVAGFKESGAV